MKKVFIISIAIILHSCSAEKKIARFVKKHGAKEVATHIAKEYPEYLRADTVRYIDTVLTTKVIRIPEIWFDTIIKTDTINDCREFHYSDKNLLFNVIAQKVNYRILERMITHRDTVYIDKEIPCPPCPTETIVQEVVKEKELAIAENKGKLSFFRNGFWVLLAILILAIGYRILRIAGKI